MYRLLVENFCLFIQGWISKLLILLPWNRGSRETSVRCSRTLIGFCSQSDHPSPRYRRDVLYILCFTMLEQQALLYSGPRRRWNRTPASSWIPLISLHLWYVWHLCAKQVLCTRVGTLIVATIYLQLIQNRYMFRSFTLLQCSHQHCLQPVANDVEDVGYL